MAENDVDFFIMDGIQTFPSSETEPEPVPNLNRPDLSSFPSVNMSSLTNSFQETIVQSPTNCHSPLSNSPTIYQQPAMEPFPSLESLFKQMNNYTINKPSTKFQHNALQHTSSHRSLNNKSPNITTSPNLNHVQPSFSAQEIFKSRDVFSSPGFTDSNGERYMPTESPNACDISNGYYSGNDFSYSSIIPCKVSEEENSEDNVQQSNHSPSHESVEDEVFCSTGIVSSPNSNSDVMENENGFEEEERTISPPINFISVQTLSNSASVNNSVCAKQALSKKSLDLNKNCGTSKNFIDVGQMKTTTIDCNGIANTYSVNIGKSSNSSSGPKSTSGANVHKPEINSRDFVLVNSPNSSNEYKLVRRLELANTEARSKENISKPEAINGLQNTETTVKSSGKPEVKMLDNLRVVITSLDMENVAKITTKTINSNSFSEEKIDINTKSITESINKDDSHENKRNIVAKRGSGGKFLRNPDKTKKRERKESLNSKPNNSLGTVTSHLQTEFKSEEKTSAMKSDTDVKFVQVRDLRERNKNVVAHTIDDSDSDVCIVDEEIKNPEALKWRENRQVAIKQLAYLRRLQSSKHLKCSECNFKTTSLPQLQAHEAAHPKGRKIKCSKCDFVTRLKSCMIYHAVMHSGGKKFRCSKCTFKTDILEKFLSHESKKVSCSKCPTECHTEKELKKHVFEAHGEGKFVCDRCPFTTRSVERMKGHVHKDVDYSQSPMMRKIKKLKGSRAKENKFVCSECYFTAPSLYLLKKHTNLIHSGEAVQIKPKPKRKRRQKTRAKPTAFKKKEDYTKFQTQFGEYLCPHCSYVSDEILFFENHLKTHTNEEDEVMFGQPADIYKCSFCEFETEYEKMIENHLLTHTEHDSDFDGDNDKDNSGTDNNLVDDDLDDFLGFTENKKYNCSSCEFQTDFEKALNRHKSLHMRKDVFNIIFSSLF